MKLYDTGVYLQNGKEIIPAAEAQLPVSREDAARNTIAYSILKAHNTSGNMDKLQIKFDKLTSHDITFVGIIQTAKAAPLHKTHSKDCFCEHVDTPYVLMYISPPAHSSFPAKTRDSRTDLS